MGRGFFSIRFRKKLFVGMMISAVLLVFAAIKPGVSPNNGLSFKNVDTELSIAGKDVPPTLIKISSPLANEKVVAEQKIDIPRSVGVEKHRTKFVDELRPGENIAKLLMRNGIDISEAYKAVSLLQRALNPRKIRSGHKIFLEVSWVEGKVRLNKVIIPNGLAGSVEIFKGSNGGGFKLRKVPCDLVYADISVRGSVIRSISSDALRKGVPSSIVSQATRALSKRIDLRRDVKPGDKFEIVYEVIQAKDGGPKKPGNLKYVSLISKNKNIKIYGMVSAGGAYGYFDNDGIPIEKNIMRFPVDGGRISSKYGMRNDPILGYSRKHNGVDIAARYGTPIRAAGSGLVKFIGKKSGYGRVVCLSHADGYSTLYAHMSKFAKGLQSGNHVSRGQIIGFVGMSGRAKGSHVHLEITRAGVRLNPLLVGVLPQNKLSGKDLLRFKKFKSSVEASLRRKDL